MSLEMKTANYVDIGKTDYSETFKLQEELSEKRAKDEIPDTILISEHYPLINFGSREVHNTFSNVFLEELKKEKIEFNELNAISYLKKKGIDFSRTSRGGGATFIGRGQINIYPIVKYEKISKTLMGVDKYKEIIDDVMFSVLKSYGLDVNIHVDSRKEDKDAGNSIRKDIWIRKNGRDYKLGGKGIHVSKGVAHHGFNFYVKKGSTRGFDYINPCGYSYQELGVTNLEEVLGKEVDLNDFKQRVLGEINKKFGYEKINKLNKIN
jgi:lipoyl(octanoyl) transferase